MPEVPVSTIAITGAVEPLTVNALDGDVVPIPTCSDELIVIRKMISEYTSRNNYLRTYPIIRDALLKGDEVWLNVIDHDRPSEKDHDSTDQNIINVGGGIFCRQCSTKFTIE